MPGGYAEHCWKLSARSRRFQARKSFQVNVTLFLLAIVGLYLLNSIKILTEYERGVIFRLGRLLPTPKGPGIILVFRPIDRMVRIPLRVETLEVPSQDVVTRDNVTVKVSAVVFFRVLEPARAVVEVKHYVHATSQLAQTRLRSVLGEADLDELLSQREKLNSRLQSTLDEQTGHWGIKVQAVEVKHVDLPEQMIRAIARQAEAERERRAKIIHADGEAQASQKLTDAAQMLSTQPTSITLRYLQTLTEIGTEKNTTVVLPLPVDLFRGLASWAESVNRENPPGQNKG